ncbi:hypothetical protein HMPREF9176_1845 [Streptococcus downei F0415]|nr:hypothetical protein HMPREF9176_1845 [Streptococcus downei F0415]
MNTPKTLWKKIKQAWSPLLHHLLSTSPFHFQARVKKASHTFLIH